MDELRDSCQQSALDLSAHAFCASSALISCLLICVCNRQRLHSRDEEAVKGRSKDWACEHARDAQRFAEAFTRTSESSVEGRWSLTKCTVAVNGHANVCMYVSWPQTVLLSRMFVWTMGIQNSLFAELECFFSRCMRFCLICLSGINTRCLFCIQSHPFSYFWLSHPCTGRRHSRAASHCADVRVRPQQNKHLAHFCEPIDSSERQRSLYLTCKWFESSLGPR